MRKRFITITIALLSVVSLLLVVGAYRSRHRIYRHVLLAEVASEVEGSSAEDRALQALDEILRIAPLKPAAVIDDDPANTLIRGWGFCDGVGMAFVQAAERAGLRGQLLFLTRRNGDSPHTVATIYIEGAWRVFDVQNRSISRTTAGDIATSDDIAAGRAPSTASHVNPRWYAETTVFYETPSGDNWSTTVRKVAITAPTKIPGFLRSWLQELYLWTPPPTYTTTDGETWETWSSEDDIVYWKARNYDVFGRSDKAGNLYREVISEGSNGYDEEAEIFLERSFDDSPARHRELTPA